MHFGQTSLKQNLFFTKTSLKRTVQFLIKSSYFASGNVLLLQSISIPMGINLCLFWTNLYLYSYESKYITNLKRTNKLRGRRFHSIFRFTDDLCALNDSGKFGKVFL